MILTGVTAPSPGATPMGFGPANKLHSLFRISAEAFPSFLPREVEKIKDPFARKMATRIERLPVQASLSECSIMSSFVKPLLQTKTNPVVLLHGFDSSCLEWRYTLPLLEEAGLETWAMDVLGWGFSDLGEGLPSCDVSSKRDHLYQFWKCYIKRPMLLVGPSLGASVAVDFAINHSEAVEKLVLIGASVYSEGTGNMKKLPKAVAYVGVCISHSFLLTPFLFSRASIKADPNHCIDSMQTFLVIDQRNLFESFTKVSSLNIDFLFFYAPWIYGKTR
ncbi:Alpha/beta hydrolase domain-containing protein vte7 [Sarracenia purpurea var. burkii]